MGHCNEPASFLQSTPAHCFLTTSVVVILAIGLEPSDPTDRQDLLGALLRSGDPDGYDKGKASSKIRERQRHYSQLVPDPLPAPVQ